MGLSKKARYRRFMGRGNAHHNGVVGWKLACSRCNCLSRPISNSGAKLIPPEIIIKKFIQLGWVVGTNSQHDLCPECKRGPIKSRSEQSAKTLTEMVMPPVAMENRRQIHFADIKAVIPQFDQAQTKELIRLLREHIPPKPPRPKKQRLPSQPDPDYEEWLEELAKKEEA